MLIERGKASHRFGSNSHKTRFNILIYYMFDILIVSSSEIA